MFNYSVNNIIVVVLALLLCIEKIQSFDSQDTNSPHRPIHAENAGGTDFVAHSQNTFVSGRGFLVGLILTAAFGNLAFLYNACFTK